MSLSFLFPFPLQEGSILFAQPYRSFVNECGSKGGLKKKKLADSIRGVFF